MDLRVLVFIIIIIIIFFFSDLTRS